VKIFTDSPAFAADLIPMADRSRAETFIPGEGPGFKELEKGLFPSGEIYQTEIKKEKFWEYGFITEYALNSQYDLLLCLSRNNISLPESFFCLAGSGENFHGQRKRAWKAEPGNIHLTVFFRPEKKIADFLALFPSLAAVSVVETIDSISGAPGQAKIKWVNDIVLENAKVAGFLAQSQCQEDMILTAVLGIGVNVLTIPDVKLDSFTPAVTAIAQHMSTPKSNLLRDFFSALLDRLQENYKCLWQGRGNQLLKIYHQRSMVKGKQVIIYSDPLAGEPVKIASGRVKKIGKNLELYLENLPDPVRSGRLIIKK